MRPLFIRVLCLAGVLAAGLIRPQQSQGQATGGAASLQIEPSVRASGMGRASGAVFWGLGPDSWANPALLGYERGGRFEHTRVRLVPGLASDVFYTADRVTLGAYGLGVLLIGRPAHGLGRTRLDYGWSDVINVNGDAVGTFDSWEKVQAWGIGISLSELVTDLSGSALAINLRGPQRKTVESLTRFGDVALGYTAKRVEVNLAPDWAIPDSPAGSGRAAGHAHDQGILVRLTPYNSLDALGWLPELDRLLQPAIGGWRLDLSWGESDLDDSSEMLVFFDDSNADPLPHVRRRGSAIHLAMGLPGFLHDALAAQNLGLVARSLTPLFEWGMAWDRIQSKVYPDEQPIYNRGWELSLGNIFTLRRGHIKDVAGDILDDTSGWGLGFHLGNLAAFRYDSAIVPQARELPERVHSHGWTAEVDPLAIWRYLHAQTPRQ